MQYKRERQYRAIQHKTMHDKPTQRKHRARQHMPIQDNNNNKTIPTQIEDKTRQAQTRPYQSNARQYKTIQHNLTQYRCKARQDNH